MWKRAKQHHVSLLKDLLLSGSSAAGVLTMRVWNIYNSCMDTGFCSTFWFKFWDFSLTTFYTVWISTCRLHLRVLSPWQVQHMSGQLSHRYTRKGSTICLTFIFPIFIYHVFQSASPRSAEWADWLKEIYVTEKKTNKAQAHCLILSGLMPSWATWRRNKRERNNCYWFEQILFDL